MYGKRITVLVASMVFCLASILLLTHLTKIEKNNILSVNEINSLTTKCQQNEVCYELAISSIYQEKGLENASSYLKELAKGNGLLINCHNVAHALGREVYAKEGRATLQISINLCSDGFNHGVMNAASENMSVSEYPKLFSDYCLLKKEQMMGCTHGVGHVLAKNKTGPKDVENTCKELEKIIELNVKPVTEPITATVGDLSGNCVDGWAMQRIEDMGFKFPEDYTIVSFCQELTSLEEEFCKDEFKRNLAMKGFSVDKISQFSNYCQSRETESSKAVCGFYVGESLQENTISKSEEELGPLLLSTCQKGSSSLYQQACLIGFISKKINYNIRPEENARFCNLFKKELARACLTEIANFKE